MRAQHCCPEWWTRTKATKGKGKEKEKGEKLKGKTTGEHKAARRKLTHAATRTRDLTSPPLPSPAKGSKGRKRAADTSDDRQIGEVWQDLNGLHWRMDEDGERRRAAVVVEMRPKYNMPKDSRHPDAKLKVPVLVEKFLSESEYEQARSQKRLSFQEEERQRDIDEAAAIAAAKEATKRRQEIPDRLVTTPNKVKRNLDLLFSSPGPLGSPHGSRKRHVSASPLATNASASPRPLKKLSLSMGLDGANAAETRAEEPDKSPHNNETATTITVSTPKRPRARSESAASPAPTPSKRIPLVSSTPASKQQQQQSRISISSPKSSFVSPSSSPASSEARKRREANLLRLVQLECDRRKRASQA